MLCCTGLSAPLWYIFYGVDDAQGPFGYLYMSSFLYAIGNVVFTICLGLILLFASQRTDHYRKTLNRIGVLTLIVSSFVLISILYPKTHFMSLFGIKDFHPYIYYALMVILSVSSGSVMSLANKAAIATEEYLKSKIRLAMSFIVKVATGKLDAKEDFNRALHILLKKMNDEKT